MDKNPLKKWREERKLKDKRTYSLRGLAALTGLDQSNISQIETGKQRASARTLRLLEHALDIPEGSLDSLLDTTASERGRKGYEARRRNEEEITKEPDTQTGPGIENRAA